MADIDRVKAFSQSVYLVKNNRYFDNIDSTAGTNYIDQVVDWTNQFLDELEREADWNYVRDNDYDFGTVTTTAPEVELPEEIRKLVVEHERPLTIRQDGVVVSSWEVVNPNMLVNPSAFTGRDRVAIVKRSIVFSRPLNDTELGGNVIADAIEFIPRLTTSDAGVLDIVDPAQLLVLGVAKNSTLPDIVKGGTSPSFAQKYADLLEFAKMENNATATAADIVRDNYGYIGGIY